jgi:hypothetical protein
MIALDTNVLVRLFTDAEPQQAKLAARLIDSNKPFFVPLTVSLELDRESIAHCFRSLLAIRNVSFEVDASVPSVLGGVVVVWWCGGVVVWWCGGVAIATVASFGGAKLMSVPYLFDPTFNAVALVFSAVIGMVFGYFPARRAAQMDPIEALRHE